MDQSHTGPGGDSPPATPRDRALRLVPRPVLTLETLDPDPRTIAIDGADYRLLAYDDLSLFDHARLARLDKRAAATLALAEEDDLADLSEEEIGALRGSVADAYTQIARLVVPDAPRETVAALGTLKQRAIQLAFYDAQAGTSVPGTAATPARPTGAWSWLRSWLATAIGTIGKGALLCALSWLLIAICLASLLWTR